MKKLVALIGGFLLLCPIFVFILSVPKAHAATIDVSPGQSIAAAVAGASEGDTIRVAAGGYVETNSITPTVNNLTIVGAGAADTSIENSTNHIFNISAHALDLKISGFAFKEKGNNKFAFYCNPGVNQSSGVISDSIVNGNGPTSSVGGIIMYNNCSYQLINNTIADSGYGVVTSTSNGETNTIRNNRFYNNGYAIYATSNGSGVTTNQIYSNLFDNNYNAISLIYTTATIYNNDIYNTNDHGLALTTFFSVYSSYHIFANKIHNNLAYLGGGIYLAYSTTGSKVYNNYIGYNATTNGPGGGIMQVNDTAAIFNNTIVNNAASAYVPQPNQFNLNNELLVEGGLIDPSQKIAEISQEVGANLAPGQIVGGGYYVSHRSGSAPAFYNNIVYGNGGGDIHDDTGDLVVEYSDIGDGRAGTGNISVNPLLTGYVLGEGSPCIDTANATGAPAYDIDGTTRPQRGGIDMGAYELAAAAPVLPETGGLVTSRLLISAALVVFTILLIYFAARRRFQLS